MRSVGHPPRRSAVPLTSLGFVLAFTLVCSAIAQKTTVTVAAHYGQGQKEFLLPYFDEYEQLNPDVDLVYQEIAFDDYLQTVLTARIAGQAPDIYHLYSLWGAQMAQNRVLDTPPAEVSAMVSEGFVPSAVDAVTINGRQWGIPTEINNYLLIYNKRLLQEAGYSAPPSTWDELVEMAAATTKRNAQGKITQAGYAFLQGWDSAVVHPYLALLYSLGGEPFSEDFSDSKLTSEESLRALNMQLGLFEAGATDPSVQVWDFPSGSVAMMIMAPWYKSALRAAMGDEFESTVGVAPIPMGENWKTVQYTFFYAVDSNSRVKPEAWAFLRWLNEARADGSGSRMGDMLVTLGAIPSNQADVEAHQDELGDFFMAPFIDALDVSVPEPNVVQGQEIKTILMNRIVEAWHEQLTPEQALERADREIDDILFEFY
jgi:multiple sugar transport system substrate-binding protein